jgi:membrane protease YdiL (CAAX protease family)
MFISKLTVFMVAAPFLVATSSPKALSTTTEQIAVHGTTFLITTAVLVAPIIETMIAQWLPIEILSRCTQSTVAINLGSTLFFSYLHYDEGLINAFSMIPIGIILAGTFLRFKKDGPWYRKSLYSLLATTLLHALHNGIAVGLFLTMIASKH